MMIPCALSTSRPAASTASARLGLTLSRTARRFIAEGAPRPPFAAGVVLEAASSYLLPVTIDVGGGALHRH
jgi:hypothetical protein